MDMVHLHTKIWNLTQVTLGVIKKINGVCISVQLFRRSCGQTTITFAYRLRIRKISYLRAPTEKVTHESPHFVGNACSKFIKFSLQDYRFHLRSFSTIFGTSLSVHSRYTLHQFDLKLHWIPILVLLS